MHTARTLLFLAAAGIYSFIPPATRTCPPPETVAALAQAWRNVTPLRPQDYGLQADMPAAEAACARDRLVAALEPTLGPVVGYKVETDALSPRGGSGAEPVRGTLLAGMLLDDGAELPARFGASPALAADLLLEVGDEAINDASTADQAASSIARVVPFIELPDYLAGDGRPLARSLVTALNAGARLGVRGHPVAADAAGLRRILGQVTVVLRDQSGRVLARGRSRAGQRDPLDLLLWLRDELRRSGLRLRRGDLLSLGAISPRLLPRPGLRVSARYEGLPGAPEVRVAFR